MTLTPVVAFVLLLLATYLLGRQRYIWDAALLVGLSLGLLATQMMRRHRCWGGILSQVRRLLPLRPAGWARLGALGLSAAVALIARNRPLDADYLLLFVLWVLAVALFIGTLLAQIYVVRRQRWQITRRETVALVTLLVLAGLIRGVALGRIPANLGGDEGTQLVEALELVAPPMGNPFATGWYSVPTMSFLAFGLAMKLLGATIAGGRTLSAILGTLTVATTYFLGRCLSGRRVGWLAAAIVAFSAYHIHFSRLASNQIADPLIGTLTLWLLWYSFSPSRRRGPVSSRPAHADPVGGSDDRPSSYALVLGLAGTVAGLGWYAYFGARWVTILVVSITGWRIWADRGFLRRHWRGLALFGVGWLVVALPLFGWYSVHPSPLTERYNAVSIFASGWLAREVAITGKPASALLFRQLWRSITAFHLTHDPTFWFFPQRPLLDFVTGALVLVGIVEATGRVKWPSRLLVLLWFGSTLVMAWVVTENPPSSQRGLLMLPAVALLAAWGADWLMGLVNRRRHRFCLWAGSLIAVVATLNCFFYFGVYTPRRVYGNPTAEIATAFARYTLAHPAPICPPDFSSQDDCAGAIFFMGPPRLRWGFGALSFMLRDVPGMDIAEGEVPLYIERPARFALVPERITQLDTVQDLYPGGSVQRLEAPDGRLLMVVYDWPGPDA